MVAAAFFDMDRTLRVTATMAGEAEREVVDKCLSFTETEILQHVAPSARERIDWHRERGHVIAILSSSTPYVTEPLAKHLGIPHVLCTRLNVDGSGRFVGTHVKPACYGAGKVHWAEAFARREGVDLDASFFYIDSFSDLPMLERVGIKRVINPDTRLKRHARRVGWSVEEW